MRLSLTFATMIALCASTTASAQERPTATSAPRIDRVRAGFRAYDGDEAGRFKVGLWTPVYVDVTAGSEGLAADLEFESADSEGVGTFYRVPIALKPREKRTFIGYTKAGNFETASKIGVTLNWGGTTIAGPAQLGGPLDNLGAHLYLSLGARLPDFTDALVSLAQGPNTPVQEGAGRATGPRHAVFETAVDHLPDHWFGYQSADLLILTTDSKEFLTELGRDANRPRLEAIARWTAHGGRLVVPVNHANQVALAAVLRSSAWQPHVPIVPPSDPGDTNASALKRLTSLELWTNTPKPFPAPGERPVAIAKLSPGEVAPGLWDVQAKTDDGRPLIARMPYGRGSITYLAFSLGEPPFTRWDGRVEFLKQLVDRFAPIVSASDRNHGPGGSWRDGSGQADVTTNLQRTLDNFDVDVIPFGYVALLIIVFILIVGPLDYFLLRHVFGRLEWTWITFPVIVLAVSGVAFYTANALKGHELKVNKIDLVDFDMRTVLDAGERTKWATAHGQTFFTILSPRIGNYTIGVESNPEFWGARGGEEPALVSWLGRPDYDGPSAMGRSASQGFFRRPYEYAPDAQGLVGVPIPIWTSKSFCASWQTDLMKPPFEVDLVYHTREFEGRNVRVTGTIKNNLPVDLEDVWIIFGGHCYPLASGLPAGAKRAKIALELQAQKDIGIWTNNIEALPTAPRTSGFRGAQGPYNPTVFVRHAMFFQKNDPNGLAPNHSLRYLDLSWRLDRDPGQGDIGLREAILYAHVPFQRGQADTIASGTAPLPTNLWLGALPKFGQKRPALDGTLAQDTYIRALLPVRFSAN